MDQKMRKETDTSKARESRVLMLKDFVSMAVAAIAFVISVITAYFSTIRLVDDVRVIVVHSPNLVFVGGPIGISGSLGLAFVNAGNRAVAITGVSLIIMHTSESEKDQMRCVPGPNSVPLPPALPHVISPPPGASVSPLTLDYNLKQFALRPGEIVVQDIDKTSDPNWTADPSSDALYYSSEYFLNSDNRSEVCARISIITLDDSISTVVPLYLVSFDHSSLGPMMVHGGRNLSSEMFPLVRRWLTVFNP